MPLPSGGAWPPPALETTLAKQAEWAAWYSGDPDALATTYGGQTTGGNDTTGFFASERGGFRARVGRTLERWFWGTRPTGAQPRTKLHVPLASDIAVTGANLLFGEMVAITSEHAATQQRIEQLVEDGGLHPTLLEAAELGCALGGVYLRVCWDKEAHPDGPWLSPVHADAAVPDFRWGRLSAVTFWRIIADNGQTVIRHLERHEPGLILHGLYEGSIDELGHPIPLTEAPETEGLAGEVNADGAIETGIDMLTAAYIPNMRPNRIWRSNPAAAYLGRSDLQGIEPMLDRLDAVYSSWMRDIDLGKGRLIVAKSMLENQGRGQGATFDLDREVYEALNMLDEGGSPVTLAQFAIRVDEHQRTAADFTAQAVRGAGYSLQSFGETGDVAMTATETKARKERSYETRGRKIGYWKMGLGDALTALLAIDARWFNSGVQPDRPSLEWPDGVAVDPKALAETINLLAQADAASTEIKVRLFHQDWDDPQVEEEVARIEDAQKAMLPDLNAFGQPPAQGEDPPPEGQNGPPGQKPPPKE